MFAFSCLLAVRQQIPKTINIDNNALLAEFIQRLVKIPLKKFVVPYVDERKMHANFFLYLQRCVIYFKFDKLV